MRSKYTLAIYFSLSIIASFYSKPTLLFWAFRKTFWAQTFKYVK